MPAKRKLDVRDIEADTIANDSYRKVIYTVPKQFQLVLMSLDAGETIPREIHEDTVQFIRVERGHARITVGDETFDLHDGGSITIPPGNYHDVVNAASSSTSASSAPAPASKRGRKSAEKKSEEKLKLYTIYTPPEHPPTRHQRRQPKK